MRLPLSLIVGLVFTIASSATFALASVVLARAPGEDFERSLEVMIRWQTFSHAATIASLLLLAAALFSIANRVTGYVRTLVQIAAWAHLGWLLWIVGRPMLFELLESSPGKLEWLSTTGWRLLAAVFWGATVLLTIAARAWWRPATPWVVVAAVVAVVLESVPWVPYVGAAIHELRDDHRVLYQLIWPLRELLSAGALVVLVWGILRDTPPSLPEPRRARAWLKGAEASLIVRVVAAVLIALLSIAMMRSPGAIKLVMVALPAIAMLAVLIFGWTLLGVERAALPEMPRIRLVIGAALVAWAAGIQAAQVTAAFDGLGGRLGVGQIENWSVVAPLVGACGMILACSAIATFALRRDDQPLREIAISSSIVFGILTLAMFGLPFLLRSATSQAMALGIALILGICAISSLLVVARVFGRAADAIGAQATLPEARLHR